MIFQKGQTSAYFIGIGGSGMQPLALLASAKGVRVSGSDPSLNSSQILSLKKNNIYAHKQIDPKKIDGHHFVVYSSAIPIEHPERVRAIELQKKQQTKLLHRMDFLNMCMEEYISSFAIGGTHGKSSSTAMLGWLLLQCNLDPTILLGARPLFLEQSFRLGTSDLGIYESDESDGSFLKSKAKLRLVLNIDEDHLEHYGSFQKLTEAFRSFCEKGEILALYAQDPTLTQISQSQNILSKSVFFSCFTKKEEMENFLQKRQDTRPHLSGYFSETPSNSPQIEKKVSKKTRGTIETLKVFSQPECSGKGSKKLYYLGQLQLETPGHHFIKNALGVLALVMEAHTKKYLNLPETTPSHLLHVLSRFPGVERRLEKIGVLPQGAYVYDDYGHHHTEIQAVLKALRSQLEHKALHNGLHNKGRLVAIFQPHRYSRTSLLYTSFAKALSLADEVLLLPIYGAGEKNKYNISSVQILEELQNTTLLPSSSPSPPCQMIKESDLTNALRRAKKNDFFVALGAGNISQLIRKAFQEI